MGERDAQAACEMLEVKVGHLSEQLASLRSLLDGVHMMCERHKERQNEGFDSIKADLADLRARMSFINGHTDAKKGAQAAFLMGLTALATAVMAIVALWLRH